jgi:hypothetical protein
MDDPNSNFIEDLESPSKIIAIGILYRNRLCNVNSNKGIISLLESKYWKVNI